MTDDYDFRASERRRARELDELEARRLRARERQRAQLRAAHRRRRLTVLGVLGLVIGVASGAWVWTSGTPKARRPIVPVKVVAPAKKAARTMPAVTRGVHISEAWAGSGKPGYLDHVLATPGLNLIELDVKDENGEVAGLGANTPSSPSATAPRATTTTSRRRHAHRARPPHLGRRAHRQLQGPDRRRGRSLDRDPRPRRAASGRTAAACRGSTSTARAPGST